MRQGHATGKRFAMLPGTLLFWGKFFSWVWSETQVSDDRRKCRLGKTTELRKGIFSLSGEISKRTACVLGSVFWNQISRVTCFTFLHRWPALAWWKNCESICWHGAVGQPGLCRWSGRQLQAGRNLQRSVTSHMQAAARISSVPGRKGPAAVPRLISRHMCFTWLSWGWHEMESSDAGESWFVFLHPV